MKFRKAHFRSILVTDLAKLTYWETFVEYCTTAYATIFLQDVLHMTTSDWLKLPIQLVVLLLLPALTYRKRRVISRMVEGYYEDAPVYIRDVTMYWRHWDDFESQPDSYLRK